VAVLAPDRGADRVGVACRHENRWGTMKSRRMTPTPRLGKGVEGRDAGDARVVVRDPRASNLTPNLASGSRHSCVGRPFSINSST
jgi:hypothetical protein